MGFEPHPPSLPHPTYRAYPPYLMNSISRYVASGHDSCGIITSPTSRSLKKRADHDFRRIRSIRSFAYLPPNRPVMVRLWTEVAPTNGLGDARVARQIQPLPRRASWPRIRNPA